jgi:4-oxalocrotonate tautomerase family enzyme
MPVVRVSMWSGVTQKQKAELALQITRVISKVVQAPPDATTLIFEDIEKHNWARSGILYTDDYNTP